MQGRDTENELEKRQVSVSVEIVWSVRDRHATSRYREPPVVDSERGPRLNPHLQAGFLTCELSCIATAFPGKPSDVFPVHRKYGTAFNLRSSRCSLRIQQGLACDGISPSFLLTRCVAPADYSIPPLVEERNLEIQGIRAGEGGYGESVVSLLCNGYPRPGSHHYDRRKY